MFLYVAQHKKHKKLENTATKPIFSKFCWVKYGMLSLLLCFWNIKTQKNHEKTEETWKLKCKFTDDIFFLEIYLEYARNDGSSEKEPYL